MSQAWAKLREKAIDAIEKNGALLVYPIKNKSEPRSLWNCLFPRSKMDWNWSDDADNKVSRLWILREELSRSGEVVYAKWYQRRATFFSKDCFVRLLCLLRHQANFSLTPEGREIKELLEMDSPLSTKQIKHITELRGKSLEPIYNRAINPLWAQLEIVGFGEKDEGHFPSLLIGATSTLFEELSNQADNMTPAEAHRGLKKILGPNNPFYKKMLNDL